MPRCQSCGAGAEPDEVYSHCSQTLFDDFHMDVLNLRKACDSWAVCMAERTPKPIHHNNLLQACMRSLR
jgi:hypothetical protein